ncbi:grasp-with-spasm system ATP-grasp peptide maturase [Tenacibaculum agarivorans]|uniref:grasp-with-spasm system ATP-grasp peptide maturase n=1 Tax=Tenacibaculum agarivorans TaxID=1908389 RepID=UPI00094BBAD0|nr:grasp-with-spasm system ATP-grasp peptide maturase [Tenacibaculum agarivorans]
MILILSEKSDITTNQVLDWCIGYQTSVIRANAYDLKIAHIDYSNNYILLKYKKEIIKSTKIKAVWYRRARIKYKYPSISIENNQLKNRIKQHLHEEWSEMIRFLEQWFKNNSVPSIGNYLLKDRKLTQLSIAKQNSLHIPNTIITAQKSELLLFFKNCKKNIITKDIGCSLSFISDHLIIDGYTEEVSKEFIDNLSDTFFPSLFQENIVKVYELRIFFLKDRFYSMAIFSQQNEKSRIDVRKNDDEIPNRRVPYQLPKEIEHKLLLTMKKLNLDTGSIDMIVDTKGDYYFLEVNPSGQFGMVSSPCNYYIERTIAQELQQL